MSIELSDLKATLPNFPNEVLEEWLLPYAMSEGWPPAHSAHASPFGRWRYLLSNRPLDYWCSISWKKCERHVSIRDLDPKYQDIMVQMIFAAVQGQSNLYSELIPDLTPRFNRIKDYFAEHGIFPKPPTLLLGPGGLAIADGNHRMAVYLYCYGYLKLELDIKLQLRTNELQSYWIGEV